MIRTLYQKLSQNILATVAMAVIAVGLISLTGIRTYRQYSTASVTFDFGNSGLSDFHNGAYYPSLAFREGVNPYSPSCMDEYPISRPAPTYSPLVFLLHIPFTFVDVKIADVVFFVFNLGLVAILAWMAIRFSQEDSEEADGESKHNWFGFWFIFSLILISRPGHITLFTGYFTLEMVLGAMMAIHYANSRPVVSGLGLMFASLKPTFVIPLAILMLCRRNVKAVIYGAIFSALAAAIGLGWLVSSSSLSEVIKEIQSGQQELHDDVTELPMNSWTRTDIAGMTAKMLKVAPGDRIYLACMLALLVIPGMAVYRLSKNGKNGAASLSGAIIVVSILLSIYHHSYDCLLMVVPWIGITFYGSAAQLRPWDRRIVSLMMAVVAANYLSTQSARRILGFEQADIAWQLITLINGVCLFVALVVLLGAAFRNGAKTEA